MSRDSASWRDLKVEAGCRIKVWMCVGARNGHTVLITAGIHGDEYEGPAAVIGLTKTFRPENVSGVVIAIPVVNPLAFAAGSRTTPDDGLNLARVFPGNPNGSITERLAYAVFTKFVSRANYLIDLHSGGVEYVFVPLSGFTGNRVGTIPLIPRRCVSACRSFGSFRQRMAYFPMKHRSVGLLRSVTNTSAPDSFRQKVFRYIGAASFQSSLLAGA